MLKQQQLPLKNRITPLGLRVISITLKASNQSLHDAQSAGGTSPWTADLSNVTGKTAQSRNKAIKAIIKEELPKLRLSYIPEYSPFAAQGVAHKGLGTKIGYKAFVSREKLKNTILHEELHHRWYQLGIKGYHHSPDRYVTDEKFY